MTLKTCKECGNKVSTKADKCPSCGAPTKKKTRIGCLGAIILIVIIGVLASYVTTSFQERSKEKKRLEQQKRAAQLEGRRQTSFFNSIEKHYQELLRFHNANNLKQASNELRLFKKYKKLDYKDVADIDKKIRISALENRVRKIPVSKYSENLDIYQQLLSLDPKNQRYKQKVAFYKGKLEGQSQRDEKNIILNSSYFGNFVNLRKQKFIKSREDKLKVWEPHATYQAKLNKTLYKMLPQQFNWPHVGVLKVSIEYDEIWQDKNEERQEMCTIYWLNDKVQAITHEDLFISNPTTGERFLPSIYKVTELYDRESVLEEIQKE